MLVENSFFDVVVVGAGAAGVFAAIRAAELLGKDKVLLLEKGSKPLTKVKISGGGRCNVSHALFDPQEFVKNYPRGARELLSPFHQFHVKDLIQWFETRGLRLKTESDGRIFPQSDSSQTVIDCFLNELEGVCIRYQQNIVDIQYKEGLFQIFLNGAGTTCVQAKKLLLATGSIPASYSLAKAFSHTIVPPVPSLFSFNIPSSNLLDLAGISVEDALLSLPDLKLKIRGPLLCTHWGFSGPAVLKLSALAARTLHASKYQSRLLINWLPSIKEQQVQEMAQKSTKKLLNEPLDRSLAKQLWLRLVEDFDPQIKWKDLSKKHKQKLLAKLQSDEYHIQGTTRYKQEFVTAGGVELSEINFKTMESKLQEGLYFAGELLNIDGLTGGFNFQAAWTCGYIAGSSIAKSLKPQF